MLLFKAHAKPITALAFSPDGAMLATASGTERLVRLWDLTPSKPAKLREWPFFFPSAVVFSPDARVLAAGTSGAIRAWDLSRDAQLIIEDEKGGGASLCMSKDGTLFARKKRWTLTKDSADDNRLEDFTGDPKEDYGVGPVACTSDGATFAAHFCPDGGPPTLFLLRDTKSGKITGKLHRDAMSVPPARACFSPDGTLFATSYGHVIVVWDVASGKEIQALSVGKKHVPDVAFTQSGKRLIAVSNDETVRQWDTSTWKEHDVYQWKIGKLTALDVSMDGCRIASAGQSGKVIVWDVDDA